MSLLAGCGWFGDDAQPLLPLPEEQDISFGPLATCGDGSSTFCGGSQTLDIYRSDVDGPNPVLIWIHGGGFVLGDKSSGIREALQGILDDGWDIVSINYRLTLDDRTNAFPAAVQDVNRAVRWVRANADSNGWNPDVVAVAGHSAGGNLAAMAAVGPNRTEFEDPELPGDLAAQDASVLGAIAIAPVSDIEAFAANEEWDEPMAHYLACDGACTTADFARGSVHTYVTSDAAPVLALHGVDDALAGPEQGRRLQGAFDDAGIGESFELIVIDDGPERFRGHDPDFERWVDTFREFLEANRPDAGNADADR